MKKTKQILIIGAIGLIYGMKLIIFNNGNLLNMIVGVMIVISSICLWILNMSKHTDYEYEQRREQIRRIFKVMSIGCYFGALLGAGLTVFALSKLNYPASKIIVFSISVMVIVFVFTKSIIKVASKQLLKQ